MAQPVWQAKDRPATPLPNATELTRQLNQLFQAKHLGPTQFQHLRRLFGGQPGPARQATDHRSGNIFHPDRLKLCICAGQRHKRCNFLQGGKEVQELVLSTKNHARTQNGQREWRLGTAGGRLHQGRFPVAFAAQVHGWRHLWLQGIGAKRTQMNHLPNPGRPAGTC